MIELRLSLFENGKPDRHFAMRLTEENLELATMVPGDLGPFNSPEMYALNNRRGQSALIKRAALMLGNEAADFRDDRDGWNGERRAEIIASSRGDNTNAR